MTRFKDCQQQKVYDHLINNPPVFGSRSNYTRLGGCTLSSAFNAARHGIEGVHKGIAGSLQRAAWTAGRDYQAAIAKAEGRS